MSKHLNYLNILDKNAVASEEHAKDPKAAMTKHSLTENKQAAVISADKKC